MMSFQEMVDSKDLKAYHCHRSYNKAKKYVDLIDEVMQTSGWWHIKYGIKANMYSSILSCTTSYSPSDSESPECTSLPVVWTTGSTLLEAGLFLRGSTAEDRTVHVSFDAIFNMSPATCLTSSIKSTCLDIAAKVKVCFWILRVNHLLKRHHWHMTLFIQ